MTAPAHPVARRSFTAFREWQELAQLFERSELPHERWDHEAHLAVATWYLVWHDFDEALARMRDGIRNLNARHPRSVSGRGYHETLTRFYMVMARRRLAMHGLSVPLLNIVNAVVADLNDRSLPLRYYSADRLGCEEARAGWIEPDLLDLQAAPDGST
jgi:hypothetical protein